MNCGQNFLEKKTYSAIICSLFTDEFKIKCEILQCVKNMEIAFNKLTHGPTHDGMPLLYIFNI